jgi:tetratricopeptide (TPR) repeat protein
MVPMIGIVQVGKQAMADRYAYQPYMGLFLMICWGVGDWYQQKRLPATLPIAASAVVLAALAIVARRQVDYWKNDVSLWKHAVAVTKNNALAEYSVGNALVASGDRPAAMPYFYRAWALDPNDPWTNLQIGWYDCDHKHFTEAIPYFNVAVSAGVQSYQGDAVLSAYRSLAAAYRDLGDLARARDYQAKADELKQNMPAP